MQRHLVNAAGIRAGDDVGDEGVNDHKGHDSDDYGHESAY